MKTFWPGAFTFKSFFFSRASDFVGHRPADREPVNLGFSSRTLRRRRESSSSRFLSIATPTLAHARLRATRFPSAAAFLSPRGPRDDDRTSTPTTTRRWPSPLPRRRKFPPPLCRDTSSCFSWRSCARVPSRVRWRAVREGCITVPSADPCTGERSIPAFASPPVARAPRRDREFPSNAGRAR